MAQQNNTDKQLSAGTFAKQEARGIGLQLGGGLVGAGIGYGAAKMGLTKLVSKLEFARGRSEQLLVGAGALIGLVFGAIASGYEHWVKTEQERLSVQEINGDVASLMEKRVQFEDTLDKQHSVIQEILEQRKQAPADQPVSEKILADREKSAEAEPARS